MYAVVISRILLRLERVAALCAAFTARPGSSVKLIDLYLSLEYGFSLLMSCNLPFPSCRFKNIFAP
jgi:hypothetical protein